MLRPLAPPAAPQLRGLRPATAAARPSPGRRSAVTTASYRFPHPLQKALGARLTGSKSKKVVRLWQAEVAVGEAARVADELRLLLALRPAGLALDDIWPALRAMVRARPDSYSPVVGGRLDKPDRAMQRVLAAAGHTLKSLLASLPDVQLSGEGSRVVAALSAAARAAQPQAPAQPLAADSPGRVTLRRARIRDLSARVLGLVGESEPDGAWRARALEEGRAREAARAEARRLLAEAAEAAAAAATAAAAAAADGEQARPPDAPAKRKEIFPEWRRVRPPLRAGGKPVYVAGGVAAQRAAARAAAASPSAAAAPRAAKPARGVRTPQRFAPGGSDDDDA